MQLSALTLITKLELPRTIYYFYICQYVVVKCFIRHVCVLSLFAEAAETHNITSWYIVSLLVPLVGFPALNCCVGCRLVGVWY
jgi:ABC-type polysaccharide/polyol phosphate export permease